MVRRSSETACGRACQGSAERTRRLILHARGFYCGVTPLFLRSVEQDRGLARPARSGFDVTPFAAGLRDAVHEPPPRSVVTTARRQHTPARAVTTEAQPPIYRLEKTYGLKQRRRAQNSAGIQTLPDSSAISNPPAPRGRGLFQTDFSPQAAGTHVLKDVQIYLPVRRIQVYIRHPRVGDKSAPSVTTRHRVVPAGVSATWAGLTDSSHPPPQPQRPAPDH